MKKLISLLFVLIFFAGVCNPAAAQKSKNPLGKMVGPFIDIHFNGNYFNATNGSSTLGGGGGGKIGIGFTNFSLYTGINIVELSSNLFSDNYEDERLFYFDWKLIGAQYYFQTDDPALIPYADLAFTLQYFTPPPDREVNIVEGLFDFTGLGPTISGGIKYFLGRTIALDLGLELSYGFYGDRVTIAEPEGQTINSFNAQINIGFSLYPLNTIF